MFMHDVRIIKLTHTIDSSVAYYFHVETWFIFVYEEHSAL